MTRLRKIIAAILFCTGLILINVDPELSSFTATMLAMLAGVVMIGAGMLLAVKGGVLRD